MTARLQVRTILLIPAEGDPHKLLGDPESVAWRYGWRPPVMTRSCRNVWGIARPIVVEATGLVLAAEGWAVSAGCQQMYRVALRVAIRSTAGITGEYPTPEDIYTEEDFVRTGGGAALRRMCEPVGTLILLDESGMEIQL